MAYQTKIALIITTFLWASAFVGIRMGLHDYSPEGLALLRYLVASFCMGIVYFRLPYKTTMSVKHILALLMIGAIGIGFYNISLNYGEITVTSGMASFIISQSPIITTFLAVIFLGEKINHLRLWGFLVSFIGIACISLGEKKGFKWEHGVLYILLATIAGGCFSVLQKPFLKKYHIIEVTTYVIWGGTLFLAFYGSHLRHDLLTASYQSTLTVLYLGIFPAALGYLSWSYVLSKIPASRAVSFLYFMPFVATILGWMILNEVPMFMSLIGGLLAIAGVWL